MLTLKSGDFYNFQAKKLSITRILWAICDLIYGLIIAGCSDTGVSCRDRARSGHRHRSRTCHRLQDDVRELEVNMMCPGSRAWIRRRPAPTRFPPVTKEVTAHNACWAQAGPPPQNGPAAPAPGPQPARQGRRTTGMRAPPEPASGHRQTLRARAETRTPPTCIRTTGPPWSPLTAATVRRTGRYGVERGQCPPVLPRHRHEGGAGCGEVDAARDAPRLLLAAVGPRCAG